MFTTSQELFKLGQTCDDGSRPADLFLPTPASHLQTVNFEEAQKMHIKKRHPRSYPKVFSNGKWRDAHRVVMEDYLGRPLDRCEIVHHLNGNITDYSLENLDIMLLSAHTKGHKHGRPIPKVQGENSPHAKLNELSVAKIKALLRSGAVQKEIASLYGVHPTLIGKIKNRIIWAHVA